MGRQKIITISKWTRLILLTLCLWLSFQMGFLNDMAPGSPIHSVTTLNSFIVICLLVWMAPSSISGLTAQIWNKMSPVNEPTFIEDEIIYILSALIGLALFTAIFLNIGISDVLLAAPIIFLAALPGSICAYIFQRLNASTLLDWHAEHLMTESIDDHATPQGFDPSSLHIIGYFTASAIFSLILVVSVSIIVFFRGHLEPANFISIISSIAITCGFIALLLTIFGHAVMPIGMKIKTKLNIIPSETRAGIASTWLIGFMTITTIFIVIFGGVRPPTSITAFLASWHLWVTYILFGVSSYVGGLALKSFYTPKPISTVFA